MDHQAVSRRKLLGAAGWTAASASRVLGAGDRIRAALIGCGNRGCHAHLPSGLALGVEFAALCDVYRPAFERARAVLGSSAAGLQEYSDYRRVLERKDIDAVFVATPDHWHAPIVVDACAAGKDVYVEKPLANSIEDCQAIVAAVKKTGRIVQVGLQQRSMKIYRDALALIDGGLIGKVYRCSMTWGGLGWSGRREDPVVQPPADLDWEAFQGPAPRCPYRATRQRSWRHYWEYGSGSLTDLGVHLMDVTRWFLRAGTPESAHGVGVRSLARTAEQVPDVAELIWKFDRFTASYTTREGMMNTFWGERGSVSVNRSVLRTVVFGGTGRKDEVNETRVVEPGFQATTPRVNGGDAVHVRNFLECVRSRQAPNSDVESAFLSTMTCLLAARSVRTGKSYTWDGSRAKEV